MRLALAGCPCVQTPGFHQHEMPGPRLEEVASCYSMQSVARVPTSPAHVATHDDVTPEDGARRHVLVDQMRNDSGGHGELDGGGVDDADDVA